MTDEEARAEAYLNQQARRDAFRRNLQLRLRGNPVAARALYERMKAITGRVDTHNGRPEQDNGES